MTFACVYLPNTAYLSEIITFFPHYLFLYNLYISLFFSYYPPSCSFTILCLIFNWASSSQILPHRLSITLSARVCVCMPLVSRPYPLPLHLFGPTHTSSDWLLVLCRLTFWELLTSSRFLFHPCFSLRTSTRALHLVKASIATGRVMKQ